MVGADRIVVFTIVVVGVVLVLVLVMVAIAMVFHQQVVSPFGWRTDLPGLCDCEWQ